jgi:cytochrome c oxidase cbb3-type subunit III
MVSVAPGFWAGWVVTITAVSVIGLVWLVISVYFGRDDSAEVASHVWDETLREGTTRAPLWWFWFILALLAMSVVYLILYPGLGTYAGALKWSQGGRLADSVARYEEHYGPKRERIAQAALAELQGDEAAMRSAWHVFNANCSACHGRDAAGQAFLFPNLCDSDWQWGREEAQLTQTISMGRQAVMPPWQAVLNDDGVTKMADYVIGLSKGASVDPAVATQFTTYCSACHAPDGGGLALLGAPSLKDDAWLYGGSAGAVRESIANGRTGVMPAFGQRLDATQIKLLSAWLASGAKAPSEN